MPKLLKPFDYYLDCQDDLLLLQLRQETPGLDDIDIDHAPRNFENITRGMYRHLEELLITPKKNRLDAITPYFLYPLF